MLQFVINTTLLRELDNRKLINAYAKHCYNDDTDVIDDVRIKENLVQLLD